METGRQLVGLGAAGAAIGVAGEVVTSASSAGDAAERLGGVHISVLTKGTSPEPLKGFPHHWTMTAYGRDNALNGHSDSLHEESAGVRGALGAWHRSSGSRWFHQC